MAKEYRTFDKAATAMEGALADTLSMAVAHQEQLIRAATANDEVADINLRQITRLLKVITKKEIVLEFLLEEIADFIEAIDDNGGGGTTPGTDL